MPHIKLEFTGFDEVLKKLTKLDADTEKIADEALKETFKIVTAKAEAAIQKPNLPKQGKFSRKNPPNSASSLLKTPDIKWSGTEGEVHVGFNIKKGGLPTIFMITAVKYGSPRRMKVQAVYDAFYGDQTTGQIRNAQRDIFYKALEEFEG